MNSSPQELPWFVARLVRARTWLGITLAPLGFASNDPGDVSLALLFGAQFQNSRPDHGQAHAGSGWQGNTPSPLREPGVAPAQATATVLRGPGGAVNLG